MAMSGEWLKETREAKGLTQPDVAKATGVTQQTVSNWELGLTRPNNPSVVLRLAELLDVGYDVVVNQLAELTAASVEEAAAAEVLDERLDRIETEMAARIEQQEDEIAELRQQVERLQKARKDATPGLRRRRSGK